MTVFFPSRDTKTNLFSQEESQDWNPASLKKICITPTATFECFSFVQTSTKLQKSSKYNTKTHFSVLTQTLCPINFRVFLQRHSPALYIIII